MFYILAAVASESFFMVINIIWMRLRRRNVSARAILSVYVFAVPLLLGIAAYQVWQSTVNLSATYWLYVFSWVIFCCIMNIIKVFVLRFISLTEISVYQFTISVLMALVADYIFLDTKISVTIAVFIVITLTGGTWLNFERNKFLRKKDKQTSSNFGVFKLVAFSSIISALSVTEFTLVKKALEVQENFVFHTAVAESFLFMSFFSYGGFSLIKNIKERQIFYRDILTIVALSLFAIFLGYFSYTSLPVVIIILLGILRPFVFTIHDLWIKDIPFSLQSLFSCFLILVGVLGLSIFQNF